MNSARQLAFLTLREIRTGVFADIAVNRRLEKSQLSSVDRGLFTELVYGIVRRQRTLDAIIDRLATVPAHKQTPDLRSILQIGLYQLRFLDRINPAAVVTTTVDLAKANKLPGLAGVVNGILRQYIRLQTADRDSLELDPNDLQYLGILYSFPDWIVDHWLAELGITETIALCQAFNQAPTIDLRINRLKTDRETVIAALKTTGVEATILTDVPQAIRLTDRIGTIDRLPGYNQGWWVVQDASAQLVTQLLDPQPGEIIVDACAAPGGKTTHIAELMDDRGRVIAIDKVAARLKKLQQNIERLELNSIEIKTGDSCDFSELINTVDRVLLDAPCSGLGTLHRRADARWQKQPDHIEALAQTQAELLTNTARWVKSGGVIVYATCTVHPLENDGIILPFLASHPDWQIELPTDPYLASLTTNPGWIKVWLHRDRIDGFFMVKLRKLS
jgi:16S rRNA (cytosine967-C5)-methyltransferase